MSIYSPFTGKVKVEVFHLDDPMSKISYEKILNSEDCVVVKEEFSYSGREKTNPIITVWYEDQNS